MAKASDAKDNNMSLRFLAGTDYLDSEGKWQRAEVGDVRDDVLIQTARWLVLASAAEWVKPEAQTKDKANGNIG